MPAKIFTEKRIALTGCELVIREFSPSGGEAFFEPDQFTMRDNNKRKSNDWNTALDVFISICLAMTLEGIDLDKSYFKTSLNQSFDQISDQYGDSSEEDHIDCLDEEN